jgi:hypothetical protein
VVEFGMGFAQHAQRKAQLERCEGLAQAAAQPPESAPRFEGKPGKSSFEKTHRIQLLCEVVKSRSRIVDLGFPSCMIDDTAENQKARAIMK